ncbi:uncharacterized protein LOC122395561 [Colletes gigas]|uniref:uncharacterized protein LOC122395561 n=1 Tax=Colletes gigas TaxID=935657 RepID=UPI001C9AE09E|nr:uncharacterized protein LOC122395561 [Colletes gigas]XP_043249162.1 uncharacterized protein LOC122395561 [Colletes gigas]XP_043249163.1 uncharacterized protein LOC122395561 [Colletes gigas]XP_043249164.1 uncharacterized protein LOC122395561 [Colletes gigas]XP_043249165.1 uncharacterized protein LOC122395561 [Colletes gigas]XP_043249166.1 uncharacterized protein LOC122395561 [Colletes gigas]XP_043249167.1 uncharacterized protein LOC122395561 [Colletes gigas]
MHLKGWRFVAFVGCFVGFIGIHSYFTIISPLINPEPYQLIQQQVKQRNPEK